MIRIVLDTNCLLAIVPRKSKYYWLYELLKRGELSIAVSTEILAEYEEMLGSFYSPAFGEMAIKTILNFPELHETTTFFKLNVLYPDLDDNKFVDAAFASNANFLITHDRGFKVLDALKFPNIKRISIPDFYFQFFGRTMPD
jgi:uncharacterized protein